MDESVAIYDCDARIVYVNPATERLFGSPRAQLEGHVLWSLFPASRGNAFHLAFERVARTGAAESLEHHYQPWDRWFANRIYRTGNFVCVIASDITEQRRANEDADRARQEKVHAADRVERLQDLTGALSTAFTQQDVAQAVVRAGGGALGAAASFLWLQEQDGRLLLVAAEGFSGPQLELFRRVSLDDATPICEAVRTGGCVLVPSRAELQARFPTAGRGGATPYKAWAAVPLVARGHSLGAVGLSFNDERQFTDSDQALLTAMANQAALALERCQLFEQEREARTRAERAADRTQRLQVATTALVMAAGPGQISRELLNLCVEAVHATWGMIGLVTEDGTAVELLEGINLAPEAVEAWRRIPLEAHMPLTDAVRSRRPVWLETEDELVTRYPAVVAAGGGSGASSQGTTPAGVAGRALRAGGLAIAPLVSGQGVIGAYAMGFAGPRHLDAEEQELIVALGRISAQALDRTRREQEVRAALELARVAEKRALEANQAKDQFLAMLGHELRNPLAPILTALELMRLHAPEVLSRERMVLERQVKHMVRLVDDLLDVSRIARGKLALHRTPVDMAELVGKALELAGPLLQQRALRVSTDLPEGMLTVAGDEERLIQVVSNLLTNAAKYTEAGGSVHVSAREEGGTVVLGVRDTGVGIDAELLPRIFDVFVQGRRSIDRADGGLGLGLSIVRSLVEAHGGTITVHSDGPGRGSEFLLRLPLTAPESLTPAPQQAPHQPRLQPSATVEDGSFAGDVVGARILIVDDNEDAASMMADGLASAGYVTRVELDGPRGLAAAVEFRPQVALLDIGLPRMDGYELARQLRQQPQSSNIKLVAITGYGQLADRDRALRAGFHHHLTKPVDMARVRTLVCQLLQPTETSASSSISAPPPG